MQIKAIQTKYKGYRFRSRLEARWAVFFDTLGLKWEYEKEGFDLDGTYYLPDFWLPQVRVWVEVKGGEFTAEQMNLCAALAVQTRNDVVMLGGPPDYKAYPVFSGALDEEGRPYLTDCYLTTEYLHEHRFYVSVGENEMEQQHLLESDEAYDQAVKVARGSRFEHGENGAMPRHYGERGAIRRYYERKRK
jgi:hypothetical protein